MDTTESNIICVLCCARDFCEQQGGRAIIGMSHKCIECEGRFHGFPCSNEKTDEMNGMTCKQCDADVAWTTDTEEIGKEGGNEWQISQRNKMKNQSQKEKNNNKKIGTGPTSIMQKGSKYHERGRGRGRGGRSGTIQRHVRTHAKPAEHKINTTDPKQKPVTKQEKVHRFTLKINPAVMTAKGTTIQTILKVMTRTIDKRTGYKAVFYPTTKLSLSPKPIANISENFPSSQADQRDIFYVREFNASKAEVHLAISIPGTTQEELHASLKNTLRQYSLWLTSEELSAKTQVWIG